jgi:hypothetical protein
MAPQLQIITRRLARCPLVREVTSSWIALALMRDIVIHDDWRRDSSDG